MLCVSRQTNYKFNWSNKVLMSVNEAPSTIKMFSKHVKSYFENTSLHGLQYVGEDGRSFIEKIIWIVLFCLGVVLMILFFIPGSLFCINAVKNKDIFV